MRPCAQLGFTATALFLIIVNESSAFAPCQLCDIAPTSIALTSTALLAKKESASLQRRAFLSGLLISSTAASTFGSPAHATYSAYTHREQDWEQRQKAGDIQISNAKNLRQQLREIVPMNSDRSKVFCPNGTPSSVSPLMENKCSDRETMPSVFGRTEDVVGNSIPGFASASAATGRSGSTTGMSSLESVGGFPEYAKTVTRSGR
jgi:hypothetical protein